MAQFFLREGDGFVRYFDHADELFTKVSTAGTVAMFTTDPDHDRCMKVSNLKTNEGGITYASNIVPNTKYVFEASYKTSNAAKWRIHVVDAVGGATIWTATTCDRQTWANIYKEVTTPANCSIVSIQVTLKAGNTAPIYMDNVKFQGNVLQADPDDYAIDGLSLNKQHQIINGNVVNDSVGQNAIVTMRFPDLSASSARRIVQAARSGRVLALHDGDPAILTTYGTVYASKTYTLSGVTQAGGGATVWRCLTTANRPVASNAFRSTEIANTQYSVIGVDNDGAITLPISTNNYGYWRGDFQVTDYATSNAIKSIDVTLKAGAQDLSDIDADGIEVYAWDKSHWRLLDRSRKASKQTLTYTTEKKEQARKFVDTVSQRIMLIVKSRAQRQSDASAYSHLYHMKVAVNRGYSQKVALNHAAIPDTSGVITEVRNITVGTNLLVSAGYYLSDDRRSVNVIGQTALDVVRAKYKTYYRLIINDVQRPTIFAGDITNPKSVLNVTMNTVEPT